jgi:hypothetical protein
MINFSHPMRWFLAARLLILIFLLACVGWFIAGVLVFQQYAMGHPDEFIPYTPTWTPEIFSQILGQFGLSITAWFQILMATSILSAAVFWSVGFLIFFRKGKDWFGLYLSAVYVLFGTVSGNAASAFAGLHPEIRWLLTPLGVLAWWGLFLQLFIFPNGRFVPRWTRWIVLFLLLIYAIIILAFSSSTPPPTLILAILAMFGIGAGSQVHRFRKVSSLFERQQTKWVMAALVVVFMTLVISILPLMVPDLLRPGSPANLAAMVLSTLPNYFLALIPLSVAFAILRYRLWDIDLIIRRTLVYAVLTVSLGLVYFGSVLVLQQVFRALSGQASPVVLVLSTLAIAALFTPLRRRIQAVIDRRFFRRRYDAGQVLDRFIAQTRLQADLAEISGQLLETVNDVVEPQAISLWLPGETVFPAGSVPGSERRMNELK